eukprot:m.340039 g.340039  ORF g.340039 m.340039 type:complete len:862 (+) comp20590_c0_seq1:157-2742(+)
MAEAFYDRKESNEQSQPQRQQQLRQQQQHEELHRLRQRQLQQQQSRTHPNAEPSQSFQQLNPQHGQRLPAEAAQVPPLPLHQLPSAQHRRELQPTEANIARLKAQFLRLNQMVQKSQSELVPSFMKLIERMVLFNFDSQEALVHPANASKVAKLKQNCKRLVASYLSGNLPSSDFFKGVYSVSPRLKEKLSKDFMITVHGKVTKFRTEKKKCKQWGDMLSSVLKKKAQAQATATVSTVSTTSASGAVGSQGSATEVVIDVKSILADLETASGFGPPDVGGSGSAHKGPGTGKGKGKGSARSRKASASGKRKQGDPSADQSTGKKRKTGSTSAGSTGSKKRRVVGKSNGSTASADVSDDSDDEKKIVVKKAAPSAAAKKGARGGKRKGKQLAAKKTAATLHDDDDDDNDDVDDDATEIGCGSKSASKTSKKNRSEKSSKKRTAPTDTADSRKRLPKANKRKATKAPSGSQSGDDSSEEDGKATTASDAKRSAEDDSDDIVVQVVEKYPPVPVELFELPMLAHVAPLHRKLHDIAAAVFSTCPPRDPPLKDTVAGAPACVGTNPTAEHGASSAARDTCSTATHATAKPAATTDAVASMDATTSSATESVAQMDTTTATVAGAATETVALADTTAADVVLSTASEQHAANPPAAAPAPPPVRYLLREDVLGPGVHAAVAHGLQVWLQEMLRAVSEVVSARLDTQHADESAEVNHAKLQLEAFAQWSKIMVEREKEEKLERLRRLAKGGADEQAKKALEQLNRAEEAKVEIQTTNKTALALFAPTRKKTKRNPMRFDLPPSVPRPPTWNKGLSCIIYVKREPGTEEIPSLQPRTRARISVRDLIYFFENHPYFSKSAKLYRMYTK